MKSAAPRGPASVIWPDADQSLLLHAALDDPPPAHFAFARWCRRRKNPQACVDFASQRLLPMVYANLARGSPAFPHARYLRGLYRMAWRDSEAKLRGASQAAKILRDAAIDVMVSKGGVTASDYYVSAAERPSSDWDFYVPQNDLAKAIDLLLAADWTPARVYRNLPVEDLALFGLGLCMQHPIHGEIDLHGRLLKDSADLRIEQTIRSCARPFRLGTIDVLRPSPEHLLLHIIAHGVRPDVYATLRWITDAVAILRKDGVTFDWGMFWTLAAQAKLTARIAAGLDYLRDEFGIETPLGHIPRSRGLIERLEQRVFASPVSAMPNPRLFGIAVDLRRLDQRGWRRRYSWLISNTQRIACQAYASLRTKLNR